MTEKMTKGELIEPTAVTVAFDYSVLPADVAKDARAAAERYRRRAKVHILDTGRDLLTMKDRLGHGNFGRWLEAEFLMNERSAQRYMDVAAKFGDKSDIVSVLPPTTLYDLAAASTPAPVREEVVHRLEAGERLDPHAVNHMVRTAREAARQERRLAKMTPEERKADEKKLRRARITREQREAETQRQRVRREEEEKRRQRAAAEAANILRTKLGDDLPRFLGLVRKTWWGEVEEALNAETADVRAAFKAA
jgi:hypothetical protein